MRDLFRKAANVELIEETEVTRLIASPRDNRMVCHGVEIRSRGDGSSKVIEADLIVDASGGHAKSDKWLQQIGLTSPEEEVLDPLLTYAGQWLRMRDGAKWPARWWWTHGVFIQRVPPDDIRGAHLMKQENDRWLLTLVAGAGQYPPTDSEEVAKFVSELRSPLIAQMLPLFEPTSKMTVYRLSKNRWRHYERWKENLSGYIAIGDAACVFNPNQGQGMSVAAAEAGILRKCLTETTSPELLPRRFFAAQAKFQINPWRLAVCNDLRFSSVQGERTPAIRFFNWYRERLALSADRRVQKRLGEVDLLLKPVASIFEPSIMLRVLASPLRSALNRNDLARSRFDPSPPALAATF
jgi:2-polyprenyl-6-methoxyphenol hydroxylase-like FAD-dependent oxidoreductase